MDRTKRPRARSGRAQVRRMAAWSARPQMLTLRPRLLSPRHIEQLMRFLPRTRDRTSISIALQDLTSWYRRARQQPNPSHAEANYELHLIAHLVWQRSQSGAPDLDLQLRHLIENANDQTQIRLCSALRLQPGFSASSASGYLLLTNPHEIEWEIVGDAAARAWQRSRGGDSADFNLAFGVGYAVEIYEWATETEATWSGKPVGAETATGNRAQIANSPCGKFVLALFKIIDSKLPARQVSNMVRVQVRKRAQHQKRT